MISTEKPGSPEEVLEHFGKKGMKWGVRNRAASAEFNRKNPTREDRNRAIQRARYRQGTGQKMSTSEKAIAKRFTTGEKVVASILAVSGFGTIPIALVGTGYVVARRRQERRI